MLLLEHSGSKDRDLADESVCNKSFVDPIAHACLYSSTFFLPPASGTWEIEPLGEKLSAQQCSRWKTVYYVPWGGGGVQFSKRPRFGGSILKIPQNVIGVEILRHGTGIPCKCCQTKFWLKQKQKFHPYRIIAPTVLDCKCQTHGATPPPPMHLASSRTRVQTEITAMVQFIVSPFPFSSERKIWPFRAVVVQETAKKFPKGMMHLQSCNFAHIAFLTFPLLPPS